jgi:RNA polymerase sigma-70 factor, ECF subfamily
MVNDREDHEHSSAPAGATALLTDEALVARARAKDEAAFEELVTRYEDKLYRLAMRFVRNETDAQEILQDAFLSAWRNLPTFEGRAQFGSWMYRVTVNAALMLLRSRNRHPEVGVDEVEPSALNQAVAEGGQMMRSSANWTQRPDDQLQSEELRRYIQLSVDALPDGLRTVFLLRDVEELST